MQPDAQAVRRVGMLTSRIAAAALVAAAYPVAPAATTLVASPAPAPAVPAVPAVEAHDHSAHAHSAPHAHTHAHVHLAPARARAVPARPVPARAVGRVAWNGAAFATPQDAMRFLVRAYNAHDDRALAHVTTPDARMNLVAMRDYAPTLRLKSCTRIDSGAYNCEFWHSLAQPAEGREGYALFRVAPAARPGWYMTVLAECGDGEG